MRYIVCGKDRYKTGYNCKMKYQIDYSKKNKMISMCSLLLLLLVLFCIIYEFNMNSDREIKLEDMTIKMNEHVMKNGEVYTGI